MNSWREINTQLSLEESYDSVVIAGDLLGLSYVQKVLFHTDVVQDRDMISMSFQR